MDAKSIEQAVSESIAAIEPVDDNRGPVEFKKHAASIILKRAIDRAWSLA